MNLGLLYALFAGALWGLGYILPLWVDGFSPAEISAGRFIVYGVLSLAIFGISQLRKRRRFPPKLWGWAMALSLTGNLLFYACFVLSIQLVGAALFAILLSALPVAVSLWGNHVRKEYPFRVLAAPLGLVLLGLLCVNIVGFQMEIASMSEMILGLVMIALTIALWTWYAVSNTQVLLRNPDVSSAELTTLVGVCSLVCTITLGIPYLIFNGDSIHFFSDALTTQEVWSFVGVSIGLGLLCSWAATVLWNKAVKRLPMSLAGQLVVFEIIFGLLFVYMFEVKLPTFLEFFGLLLILGGIFLSLRNMEKAKKDRQATEVKSGLATYPRIYDF